MKIFNYGNWTYTKRNKNIIILQYLGNDAEVTVPAQIDGMNVYGLDSFVFSRNVANKNIVRVILSEGIRKIDSLAFLNSSIQEVVLPSTMQDVDGTGFGKMIKQVTVDLNNPLYFDIDGVLFSRKEKEMHLVYFPARRRVDIYKIPVGTTHIDWHAFNASKNLEQIIIPNSVIDLNRLAFEDCPKLVHVRLSPNINELKKNTFHNCIALSDVRVSRKIKTIAPDAFDECPQFNGINIQTRISEQER
jgi:hypothetical protein